MRGSEGGEGIVGPDGKGRGDDRKKAGKGGVLTEMRQNEYQTGQWRNYGAISNLSGRKKENGVRPHPKLNDPKGSEKGRDGCGIGPVEKTVR